MKPMHHAQKDATGPTPSPKFAEVAQIIAKGSPPEWLVPALAHFSTGFADEDDRHVNAVIEQLDTATDTLMRWLPAWGHLPWHHKPPDYIQLLLAFLPELKKGLAPLTKRSPGRPVDMRREVCAAVVVEAWRRTRGKVQPQSKQLFEACKAYWAACGGKPNPKDDIYNWERIVKRLLAEDYSWVRDMLGHYETHIK
jgi:hypothetical protein